MKHGTGESKTDFFGEICTPLLGFANLMNLFWTVDLLIEQFSSPWGSGTELEMAVLLMWAVELLSLPGIILGVVYLCLRRGYRLWKWNLGLTVLLALQILLCNLLVIY